MEVYTTGLLNRDLPQSFMNKFTPDDFLLLKLKLHPTNRGDAKEVTRRILTYLKSRDVVTNIELQEQLHLSEDPVLKRLKLFRDFKLVKRERNKYYRVTPRLLELADVYMDML